MLLAVAAVALLGLRRQPKPEEATDGPEPALRAWDLAGCWNLRVAPWRLGGSRPAAAPDSLPPLLHPPERVMLLPDSIDEWRRPMTTYRAVPLAGEGHEELDGHMRWFVRADTLWLVWSDRTARAGVALRERGGRFRGAARAAGGGAEGIAAAEAWKVNCATLAAEAPRPGPER